MQVDRVYEKYSVSNVLQAYDSRHDATSFTGERARGINMSEFLLVMAAIDIPKGSIVKILPYQTADITAQGEDGFKAELFSAVTDIGAAGVAMADMKTGQFGYLQIKGYMNVLFAVATTDAQPVWVDPTGKGVITAGTPAIKIIGLTTVGAFPIVSPATTVLATAFCANTMYVNEHYAAGVAA